MNLPAKLRSFLQAFPFRPRLLDSLTGYSRASFLADLVAGLTVGIVALPLAMAFAIASGVKPEQGIFTAIIAGFLISALGGSRVQIGGPAGAYVVIVYGIVQNYGLANLLIATVLSGILLFLMGAMRLGSLIRLIPVAIVIGFTNGIAVIIALSQVKDFLGLAIPNLPADFFAKISVLSQNLTTINGQALAIGIFTLGLIIVWPKPYAPHLPRWQKGLAHLPGTIIALALTTLLAWFFSLEIETIGSKFNGIPQGLPHFALPDFSWQTAKQLVGPTITIALLGAIESLLCARVADGLTHDRHDPNQELMAQGIANFVCPFFGGIPATGTIARTVTNIRLGAQSPIAGIVHALTLLLIILVAAPLAYYIPLATLAAILLFVAFNMGEWREFYRLKQFSLAYRAILLATFFLTVVFDLTVAVEVGMVLASLFFIYRIASLTRIEPLSLTLSHYGIPETASIAIYRIFGSLFFGATSKLEALIDPLQKPPQILILEMHQVINLDTSGLDALRALQKFLQKHHAQLLLCSVTNQPLDLMQRSGFLAELGENHVFPDLDEALSYLAFQLNHSSTL